MLYGKKDGVEKYKFTNGVWDRIGLGLELLKVEFWSFKYDFQFQFWGEDQNNVFIEKDGVQIHSSGGFKRVSDVIKYVVEWCEKANPRVKYPKSICGVEIDLPEE